MAPSKELNPLPHPSHHSTTQKRLLASALLNLLITCVEIIGGLLSNSLALISDALHNLGDTTAIFIAYIAQIISRKEKNQKKTFGYKRVEILAALLNAVVLVIIVIFLFLEAARRIRNPEPIKGSFMLLVSAIGFGANLLSVFLLKNHAGHSINIRAAYLHLIGDTLSSVMVIFAAIIIYYTNLYWIDSVITLLIGLYLLKETWVIIREALDILMQGTPAGLDLRQVKTSLESIEGIDNIHHVHAWNLTDSEIHFECHVDLSDDVRISETEQIRQAIHSILLNNFNIRHVTVQFEYNCCVDKSIV